MCLKVEIASLTLICLGGMAVPLATERNRQHPASVKAVPQEVLQPQASQNNNNQHKPQKYFQDVYVAKNNPKELEFGHVFENLNDWEQRFEKLNLENLNRQGKVRWGDKNGAYGEHYWDYNHAGHNQQEESDINAEDSSEGQIKRASQEESGNVPVYQHQDVRFKRNPDEDVEFINDAARSSALDSRAPKHDDPNNQGRNENIIK
ncbi:uncharacterized protein [Euwallacea similis]|uniref:uncharacterized protein isoform X2 n=1 Tax=Euwallacea similis TaxID=1736056 RepID=UPI00344E548B